MAELQDGERVAWTGSSGQVYTLQFVGGVYSCTCPAWRNQRHPIDQRTCKHLQAFRGADAETARLASLPPALVVSRQDPPSAEAGGSDEAAPPRTGGTNPPKLLLAHVWDNAKDLSSWWMSEKLDGVRAWWDGKRFWSRQGNPFYAPAWFTEGLPDFPVDGEIWGGRQRFQHTVGVVRRIDGGEAWRDLRFVAFDLPKAGGSFEARQAKLEEALGSDQAPYAWSHLQVRCTDLEHLRAELDRVIGMGGEGLMLREPGSSYEVGRSWTLLKVKRFYDAEARVVGHQEGSGKHMGRLGALLVELANGTRFAVGTGFSDAEREAPPDIGAWVTFRYQELSTGGVPRFPSYVGVRDDLTPEQMSRPLPGSEHVAPATNAAGPNPAGAPRGLVRPPPKAPKAPPPPPPPLEPVWMQREEGSEAWVCRLVYVVGASRRLWEIRVEGARWVERYGREGHPPHQQERGCPSADAALREAEHKAEEKREKGYERA